MKDGLWLSFIKNKQPKILPATSALLKARIVFGQATTFLCPKGSRVGGNKITEAKGAVMVLISCHRSHCGSF